MRIVETKALTKVVDATAQVVTFSGTDLFTDGVVALHVGINNTTGTNHDIGRITRIRYYANSTPIFNCSLATLRAFVQRMGRSNLAPIITANTLTLPLYLLDAFSQDEQDVSQFPFGANGTLELTLQVNGGAAAASTLLGAITVGYTVTEGIAQSVYPCLYSQAMNIPASSALQQFPFQDGGEVRGFGIPSAGIDRIQFYLNKKRMIHAQGAQFTGVNADIFSEVQALWNTRVITDPQFYYMPSQMTGGPGSYVELATGAGWAGVTNELTLYTLHRPTDLR